MLKYNNVGSVIEIKLGNGFSVMAMYLPFGQETEIGDDVYLINMWLKADDIDDCLPIDMQKIGNKHIEANKQTIKKKLTRVVTSMFENKELDYYIDRYNYYCDCFEIGNDQLEGGE